MGGRVGRKEERKKEQILERYDTTSKDMDVEVQRIFGNYLE